MTKLITVLACVCDRCGHSWNTRSENPPKVCSKCKSVNWNAGSDKVDSIKPKEKTAEAQETDETDITDGMNWP